MYSDITILTTRRITLALWVDRYSVEGTKVTSHTTDLFFKDLVVYPRFELSLSCGSRCDIHSCLTTPKYDERLHWRYGSTVERSVRHECLQDFQ